MRAAIVPLQVRADGQGTAGCTVVKVGGGLLQLNGALATAVAAIGRAWQDGTPLVVVGGGGPWADAVRATDAQFSHGDDAAHWMAIHAMDQYAHWLVQQWPAAVLVGTPYEAGAALDSGRLPVFAPARWLRDTDTLPHRWSVTSDTIAAYLAGALDARRLCFLKPVAGDADSVGDGTWRTAAPASLRVDALAVTDSALGRRLAD